MKRKIISSITACLATALLFNSPHFTYGQRRRSPQPFNINQVNDHLYEMTGGGISCGGRD